MMPLAILAGAVVWAVLVTRRGGGAPPSATGDLGFSHRRLFSAAAGFGALAVAWVVVGVLGASPASAQTTTTSTTTAWDAPATEGSVQALRQDVEVGLACLVFCGSAALVIKMGGR
jgi:hypothetical protein